MTSQEILQMVADFGALGLASGAIFWIFLKTSRRLDELTDSFQAQIREMQEDCNKRESEVRDRFDAVVRKYDEERLQWTTRLDSIEKEVQDTEALIKEGLGEMRSHYAKISVALGKDV
ncbi:MAG: hypothetical protein Unbinned3992contig1000_53 [Prokaryotic dsDNA virus sp.]|nr:MAG: hypothetical protein Unbinned3992contig1000_53 [Prokaryotic dsDNA virus sp.]|tara:strand:- start:12560 stop:12913 length:354 start_codon:yes stop_codon:yes gene_type:complete